MEFVKFCNRHQMQGLIMLNALKTTVSTREDVLKPMLQSVPGAWRDYRCANALLEKAIRAVEAQLEPGQRRQAYRQMDNSEVRLRPLGLPDSNQDYVVGKPDLYLLMKYAMRAECDICLCGDDDVRRCPLRRVLMAIAPPSEIAAHGCEYRYAER